MPMSGVMPLQHPKNREGLTMTPQLPQKTQQKKNEWLSPLVLSTLATVSLIQISGTASLAAAAECQFTEDRGTIQSMTTWKGSTLSILPRSITLEWDVYGGLVPSSMLEVAPMNNSRFAWGNTENQEIATVGACLRQDIRKSALFNQAMIASIGKTQAKAQKQILKFLALPYDGKRQIHTIRTTPLEIGISARDKTSTIIGPVQEFQKPILSDERSVSRSVAALPATVEFPSLFGGQPFVAVNQIQDVLQIPDNESIRMNRTTTQALHGGNCASGCP
jgi:hypothetical protein